VALVKGAPERVLAMCSEQARPMAARSRWTGRHWRALIEAQARSGRRVLALARRSLPAGKAGPGAQPTSPAG
jgi:magnesium-transporting ATPase (P-type)